MFSEIEVTPYEGEVRAIIISWKTEDGQQGTYTLFKERDKWKGQGDYIDDVSSFLRKVGAEWLTQINFKEFVA